MHLKSPKLLDDIVRSCRFIQEDTAGLLLENYLENRVVRQAVERNLAIIGEAASRLRELDPETASGITDIHQIIGLRNRLVHGYDDEIEDQLVWESIVRSVPVLGNEASALLAGIDT